MGPLFLYYFVIYQVFSCLHRHISYAILLYRGIIKIEKDSNGGPKMDDKSGIILRLSKTERDAFKARCQARGMTMTGRLMMLLVQDKWEFEANPPREYSDRWKEITRKARG